MTNNNNLIEQTHMKTLSIKETTDLIANVGHTLTVLVQGEMGSGKSSMLKALAKRFPDHHTVYCDMTTKDVGDFLIPKVMTKDGVEVTAFIPNEEFGFHLNKPVIVMLDEVGKCSKAVLNASLRLMLERQLGRYTLPKGSIVFGTTNLSAEGIGDNLPPHMRNRVCVAKMRKPTAIEWVEDYAIHSDIEPVVIGAVLEFPSMLASFEDYSTPEANQYIYDPRSPRAAFVTPRSLEAASGVIRATSSLGNDVMTHALIGTIGERAAMDMMTMVRLNLDVPRWKDIATAPMTTAVPVNAAAACMLIAKATMTIERDTIDAWLQYLGRMSAESQGLFARMITRNNTPKRTLVMENKHFTQLCIDKSYLF
jgi:hypothetical protein